MNASTKGTIQLNETELVAEARNGSHTAFAELIRTHQNTALRVAFVITASAADAEDVVQDAFVKAWRALARFRAGAEFRPWLLRIVSNEAKNRVRSRWRRQIRENRFALPQLVMTSPDSETEEQETKRIVWEAVNQIAEDERQVVICRYLLGLSERETAAVLGIPAGTVKSRLARARARLATRLEGERITS